jgi:GAF domain-containing protein
VYKITQTKCDIENYRMLHGAVKNLLSDEDDLVCALANIASFIYWTLPNVNWVGFYLLKGRNVGDTKNNGTKNNDKLVLGPFVGKPACTRIAVGKGVCGTSAALGKVVRVDNVHEFEGHIACDSESNSEIVLPLKRRGKIFGVLDVDSPLLNRFTDADEEGLTKIVDTINEFLDGVEV